MPISLPAVPVAVRARELASLFLALFGEHSIGY